MDLRRLLAYLLGGIEHHACRRCAEQRAARLRGVADGATLVNHFADLSELAGTGAALLCTRAGLLRRGRCQVWCRLAVRRGDVGQADHAQCRGRKRPGEAITVVAGVEVVARQHRQRAERGEDQPVVFAAVSAREVVADHDEQHRQGEIVVVPRTQQALGRQHRIGRAVLFDGGDQRTLSRHDDAEHVADHDGADQRAGMNVGCAAAEYLRIAPARGDHQHEQHQAEQGGGLAQRRIAEQVIDEPADDQRAESDGDGRRRGQFAARCDQVQAGVEVVHHHQQRHAR